MANKKVPQQNLSQNQPEPSRSVKLDELTDSALKVRYINTFQVEPAKEATREQLIAAINDAAPKPPAPEVDENAPIEERGKLYGNKDKDKKYPIKKDWKDKVIVRQVKVDTLNGGMVEVPNTASVQTYDKDQYNSFVDNKFFTDSKMKVEVLHMPK